MSIGEKIEERAKELGITAPKLGDKIGRTKQNVYSIYRRTSVDTDLLKKLCKVLDFNFFEWLAADGEMGTYTPQAAYGLIEKEMNAVKQENDLLRDQVQESKEKYELSKEKYELLKSVFKHETGKNPPGSEEVK